MAVSLDDFRTKSEREIVRNDSRTFDFKRCSGFRHVADDAVNGRRGAKQNRTAFERPAPRTPALLGHRKKAPALRAGASLSVRIPRLRLNLGGRKITRMPLLKNKHVRVCLTSSAADRTGPSKNPRGHVWNCIMTCRCRSRARSCQSRLEVAFRLLRF